MRKRLTALLLALVMCLSLVPTVAFADGHDGQVRVIVENTTYAKSEGAPWDGKLVDEWVNITDDSTMMSCVVAALTAKGYTQEGAANNYISKINGLAEYAGGNQSGWMGTLNDWFTNDGFAAFTVKDGKLSAGDEIRIMYTLNGGEDCGGSWNNNDKTVKSVTFSAGTLNTTFASDTHAYTLTVPADTTAVTVTPTASNKNFQVRTSVNGTEYKRTAAVPVENGTVITVKCGDPSWLSMNDNSAPAEVYTITVAKEGDDPGSEPHTPITAYVNISKDGALLKDKFGKDTARMKVELDTKTAYTIDDILRAAHAQYAPGGEAAYGSENGAYGLNLTRLWGVTNGYGYGYQINAATREVMGLTDAVAYGDTVDACIYENTYPNTEDYTAFTAYTAETETDKPLELTLNYYPYDPDTWAMVKTPLSGAVITVDGEATSYTTDADGKVTLPLTEAGEHVISAAKTKTILVGEEPNQTEKTVTAITAPVCVVTAEAPVFDPAKLMYSDFRLYPSVAAYQADPNSYYPLTPAYDPAAEDQLHYSVTLPDFQTTVFGYRTIDGVDGYLTGVFDYNDYNYTTWSSSNGMMGAGWQGGAAGVTNNYFISKANTFGDSDMYLDDYLSATIDGQYTKLANVRVKGIRSASLKSLDINGVWVDAFDKENANCSIFVDQDSNGIDITATGYKTNYTFTIGETTANSGTAIHVAYVWDENGEMVLPITVTPPATVDGYPAIPSTYTVTLKQMPKADKPVFMTQPQGAIYTLCPKDPAPDAMTVVASANGAMSYQWFKAENAEGANAVAVEGATAASYAPALTVAEDAYYFCRVTNTVSTQSADSAAVLVKVYPDPTPTASLKTVAPALTVTEFNGIAFPVTNGFFYMVGDEATPIEVEYTSPVADATVSTMWWRGNSSSGAENGLMAITPKTTASEALSCAKMPPYGMNYYCTVKATLNGRTYSADTEKLWIFVGATEDDLIAPVITTQPVSNEYDLNAKSKRISVSLDYSTNVGATYQWYVNTENSYEGATPVPSAGTSTSYTLPTTEAGTRFYFCKVTNNLQGFTKSTNSDIAQIKIRGEVPIPFTGAGTEEDPYTISTVEELIEFKRLVNVEGADFTDKFVKLTADLTLTNESWTSSIGCTLDGTHNIKSGDNLRAFPGTFDGDNHTLTFDGTGTVKPLFGYVRNTTIKNLNIQGTENVVFEDHGLISTVEGVGLSGTAAIIDHVTLKSGTRTTKSGLVGATMTTNPYAAASAGFKTTITNCVVEEGCIIGVNGDQNMIGGIAGRLICEIDNCEVSATVKGKNFVGGILATCDNAMGPAGVTNSAFHGTVISTGRNAGGIVGGGYENDSAPNGMRIKLENNTVDGTVKGVKNVGGIQGGDEFVAQSWGATSVINNTFTGKVEGTENVGAIIGFYDSLNKFNNVSGNLYAADCGADKGIGAVKYIDTNYANPTPAAGTTYFSTEFSTEDCPVVGGCNWKPAHNRTDDPLGADAAKLCKVISAPEHTVTVSVGPKTVNAFFYTDAAATVPVAADKVVDNGVKGNYHVYTVTLPEGECSYRGEETVSGVVQPIGGEQFTVGTEDFSMNLVRANFYVNSNAMTHEDDWTLTGLTNESTGKEVVLGAKYPNGTNKIMYQAALLRCGADYSGSTLTVNENLLEDYYVKAQLARFTVGTTAYSVQNKTLSISAYNRFTLVVPADAEKVEFFKQTTNYVVVPMETSEMTRTEDEINNTVVYAFKSKTTTFSGTMSYRVSKAGATTLAGYFANNTTVELKWSVYAPTATASTAAATYDDNSVLLNVDDGKDTNELAMNVGETFKLRAFRAPWQIVDTTTGNHMIEPDFHFSVLSGSDVVTVTPVTEFEEGKTSGNASGNWMNITATAPGTAVIAVWYDGIEITGSTFNGFYGATAPNRYGYVVVNVGADNTVAITPLTHDGDWDAEFDTVYYVGDEGGTFSFASDDAASVTVTNLCGTTMGSAKTVTKTDDKWNVPVYNGSNLITITSASGTDYRLVRAAQISIGYTNVTTGKTASDLSALTVTAGDTLSLHFNGLHMPIPKMSGIYNPGFNNTAKTAYVLDDSFTLYSAGTQYDFSVSQKDDLSFKVPSAGEHTLKGYISLSSMGDPFGNHRNISDDGKPVNMNAGEVFGAFGVLPEIQFTAAESDSPVFTYDEVTKVKNIQLIVGGTTAYNYYALFDKVANINDAANWKSSGWKGLACTVSSDSYYNVMTLRYWYEGETPVTVPLTNGVAAILSEKQFTVNTGKILNLQISVAPADPALGSAKLWNYVVYPGSSNLKYVHPFIKSLIAKVGKKSVPLPINTVDTNYTLEVGSADKLTLNAVQLVQVYNTATTADQSDRVTLTKLCKGEAVGESITVLEMGLPNNPNRNWTVEDLDITDVDALELKVTSYADESVSRTYHIDLMRTGLVVEKIAAIGNVTLESKSAIDAARAAYDALPDAEKAKVSNYAVLTKAEAAYADLMAKAAEKTAEIAKNYYTSVGDSLLENAEKSTPVVNSIGGEWMILGLARSGKLTDDVAAKYYDNVVETVKQAKGVLDSRKYTEYSRVVLALTAADFDATNVAGYDLTAPLTDFDKTVWQGNNGTAFGLLALNSHGYRSDNTAIRQQYVNELLNKQLDNGGWYITSGSADPDMTAMAIQALAPYYATNDSVKTAVDKALAFLSENQGADGDYGSSETCAQVVVALSALGIDAAADSRFVKNGTSVLEALCSYYAEDAAYGAGFAHVKESSGGYVGGAYNGMATEQGYYALTAYHRFKEAQTALYDMSDVCAGQHSYGDWMVTKNVSCTENGSRSHTCSACGKTETEAITAPGHKLTKTAAKTPTCTVGGNNEYFTCSACSKVFKDSGGKQETTAAAETLPAIGHKWTNATCTAPKACRNCGLTEGTSVAHSYNEKGICSVCGGKNPVSNVNTENVKVSADNDKIVTDNSGLVVKSDAAVDDTQLSEITTALTGGSIAVKIDDSMTVAKADDGGVAALKEKADTLTDEQKTEVNNLVDAVQAMRTDSAKKNEQVEMVLDICAVLKNSSGTPVAELMELPEPIIVTIPVSDALYASLQGRKIAVLRSHTDAEGAVTTAELPAEWGGKVGNRYVKFASDRFSTFALISYETVSSGSGHSAASTKSFATDLNGITAVYVDGRKLDSKYYTVSGTTVTLSESFLKTLKDGKHTFKAENATHIATADFYTSGGSAVSPHTADSGIALYAAMSVMSLMGMGWVGKRRSK